MRRATKKTLKFSAIAVFALVLVLSGFPSAVFLEHIAQKIHDRNVVDALYHATKKTRNANIIDKGLVELLRPRVEKAQAATYAIQTGTYVGNGTSKAITGLGFSPQAVIIKPDTTAGVGAVFKTT